MIVPIRLADEGKAKEMKRNLLWLFVLFLGPGLACNVGAGPADEPTAVRLDTPTATSAPTAAPTEVVIVPETATPTVIAARPPGSPAPAYSQKLTALGSWLIASWNEEASPIAVQAALAAVGWQTDPGQLVTADLTGDGRDEWLVSLCISGYQEDACQTSFGGEIMGELWVIGAAGILYQYGDRFDIAWQMAPVVLAVADMTGDGRADALIAATSCGAHTCYQHYLVLSAHYGQVANVLNPTSDELVDAWSEGTSISYSTYQLSSDDPPQIVLHGGLIGSAGAGIHRGYTEVWQWDGQAISYRDFWWDDSNYRFHRLYDANQAWYDSDWSLAQALYAQVIDDDSLEDIEWWDSSAGDVADATRQFAAFRLILLAVREGDLAKAAGWQNWLQENYGGRPLQQAAELLLDQYAQEANWPAACTAVTNFLLDFDEPLGPLHYMGYANPALEVEDVCPLD